MQKQQSQLPEPPDTAPEFFKRVWIATAQIVSDAGQEIDFELLRWYAWFSNSILEGSVYLQRHGECWQLRRSSIWAWRRFVSEFERQFAADDSLIAGRLRRNRIRLLTDAIREEFEPRTKRRRLSLAVGKRRRKAAPAR